jgi:phosphomannomutase/phosphoglucomutase
VYSSSEVRISCPKSLKKSTLDSFQNMISKNPDFFGSKIKDIITLDGMRIVFENGFALIRQSNTEPVFTLRFEAENEETAQRYEDRMVNELMEIIKQNAKYTV